MPASEKDVNVRRHLAGLLLQEESLDAFIDWFIHALWDIEHHAGDEEVDLAWRIENRLAERSGGHVTDAELLTGLRDDAREFGIPLDGSSESESARATRTVASVGVGQTDRLARGAYSPFVLNLEWRSGEQPAVNEDIEPEHALAGR